MAEQPFVIEEDVWIDHKTGRPIAEEQSFNGAFRLEAGRRISNEDAERYGLKASAAPENKAVAQAENKGDAGDAAGDAGEAPPAPPKRPARRKSK